MDELPPTRPLSVPRRLAPAVVLFFVAPLFGEFLLGNLKPSEIY